MSKRLLGFGGVESQGQAIAAFGMIVLSFDALLIRLADVSPWNAAFWRGALIASSLSFYLLLRREWSSIRYFRDALKVALIVCLLYGINTALFVFSVSFTRVSNTVVILCCTPLFSALFSWFMLGERIARHTLVAILLAMAGVLLVFFGAVDLSGGVGNLLALGLALSTAFMLTYLRRYPDFPRVPAVAIGGIISAALVAPMSEPFAISLVSFSWLALMGLIQMPIASVCMMVATRYISSAKVALFMLLETVLAPIWVYFAVNERATLFTLIGGALVMITIAIHAFIELKREGARGGR